MPATTHLALAAGTPSWLLPLTIGLAALSLGLLIFEVFRRRRPLGGGPRAAILASGTLGVALLGAAVLRPERVTARENSLPAKVTVLTDRSRSMALAEGGTPRWQRRDDAVHALEGRATGDRPARIEVLPFHDGLADGEGGTTSDLAKAVDELSGPRSTRKGERPKAIVVVSDGRLTEPSGVEPGALRALGLLAGGVPIHTVFAAGDPGPDAAIARVRSAGNAVAHAPLPLRVTVRCVGGLACGEVRVAVAELREDGPKVPLATGVATVKGDGEGEVEIPITLDRAGTRVIEVSLEAPSGDAHPENDRRYLPFEVTRDRVRVLHVAGRPTNDVRALRDWLKANRAVDVVSFFILRTPTDNPRAPSTDLSLIPFPVDELFTEHLPSFDAVVLQDFDAQPYGLERHLGALARYVRGGGGLVMVGGPNSFVAGGYAGTPLADVLPVTLDGGHGATSADLADVTPAYTPEGREAPLLAPLRALAGEELPAMPGTNIVGDVRPGALALWVHPARNARDRVPMPILALGDAENGRSIALTVDGSWTLAFSPLGERTAGRAHAAFWDGLLGWLMRDSRYELLQLGLESPCVSPAPSAPTAAPPPPALRVRGVADPSTATVEVRRMGEPSGRGAPIVVSAPAPRGKELVYTLPALPPGGYTARATLKGGFTTTYDFACEVGGDEWADTRPDEARLRALAEATGGVSVRAADAGTLPLPPPTVVTVERQSRPVLASWAWSLLAALSLGAHWLLRRRARLL